MLGSDEKNDSKKSEAGGLDRYIDKSYVTKEA
jgi:hypothetical protein